MGARHHRDGGRVTTRQEAERAFNELGLPRVARALRLGLELSDAALLLEEELLSRRRSAGARRAARAVLKVLDLVERGRLDLAGEG